MTAQTRWLATAAWLSLSPWALAQAQPASSSQLQIYGIVDMALSAYHGEGAGTRSMITSSGNQASRVGFRGLENLGGGMQAGFDLEAGLNVDTGAGLGTNTNNQPSGAVGGGGLTFNRKSYLFWRGALGELRLGRDYTPSFWNTFVYDPYRVGVGISGPSMHGTTSTGIRASNSVGYYTPGCSSFSCKGPFLQLMAASGENTSGSEKSGDGNYWGLRAGYGAQNWDVALASGKTKNRVAGNFTQTNIGASYLWQGHRLMLLAGENRSGRAQTSLDGANRVRFAQVGGWIKVGNGADYIPTSYTYLKRNDSQGSTAHKLSIGYVHALSRRTALYGTLAYIHNSGSLQLAASSSAEMGPTPVPGGAASGIDLGIRHNF